MRPFLDSKNMKIHDNVVMPQRRERTGAAQTEFSFVNGPHVLVGPPKIFKNTLDRQLHKNDEHLVKKRTEVPSPTSVIADEFHAVVSNLSTSIRTSGSTNRNGRGIIDVPDNLAKRSWHEGGYVVRKSSNDGSKTKNSGLYSL